MNFSIIKNLDLKNRISASVTIFVLSVALVVYYFIIPTIQDIEKMGMEIEKQKIDLEEKYQKGQSLKKLAEDLKKIEPLTNQLDDIYINKEDSLSLITDLESTAAKNGVTQKINLVSVDKNNPQYFQKIPIQLFTSGSFTDQINNLGDMELMKYYINVKSIEMSVTQGQARDGGPTVNTLIFADTYWH